MWYKAWMETRWRVVLLLLLNAGISFVMLDDAVPAAVWLRRLDGAFPVIFCINAIMLASAGLGTRTSFRPWHTIDGSMLYTLSLPLSRRWIVVVRQLVGWAAAMTLIATTLAIVWWMSPSLRAALPMPQLLRYGVALLAAASVAYAVSALLAAVLEQLWQTYAAIAIVVAVLFLVPDARIWQRALVAGGGGSVDVLAVLAASVMAVVLAEGAVRLVQRRDF